MVKHLRKIIEFKVLKLVHFYMKIDILKLKKLQLLGDFVPRPDPLTRGFALDPTGGTAPRPPYRLALPQPP